MDPAIGVQPMTPAFENHLKRCGTKDLETSLSVPDKKPRGWKRAVNSGWMNALSPLAYDLVKEARNAVLPSKKVKLALQKVNPTGEVERGLKKQLAASLLCTLTKLLATLCASCASCFFMTSISSFSRHFLGLLHFLWHA